MIILQRSFIKTKVFGCYDLKCVWLIISVKRYWGLSNSMLKLMIKLYLLLISFIFCFSQAIMCTDLSLCISNRKDTEDIRNATEVRTFTYAIVKDMLASLFQFPVLHRYCLEQVSPCLQYCPPRALHECTEQLFLCFSNLSKIMKKNMAGLVTFVWIILVVVYIKLISWKLLLSFLALSFVIFLTF